MMERQLTRIKIRDLRSDYANYWRKGENACTDLLNGAKQPPPAKKSVAGRSGSRFVELFSVLKLKFH